MKKMISIVVLAVILIGGGMYYFKQQAKPASKPNVVDAIAIWKTYTNNEGEFSIQYPPEWKLTEGKPTGNSQAITLEGKEGNVWLEWGSGFGGTCDPNKETLKLYNNSVLTCSDTLNKDGTENWSFSSIGELPYQKVNSVGHIVGALASKPSSLNRAVILKIFSTIKYTGPNQAVDTSNWKTYTNKQYGFEVKYPQNYTYSENKNMVFFDPPININDDPTIFFTVDKEPQTLLFQGTFSSVPQSKAGNTKLIDNWTANIAINGTPFKRDIWLIRGTLLAINFYTKQQNNYLTASLGLDVNSTAKTDSEAFYEAMNNDEKLLIFDQMLYSFKFINPVADYFNGSELQAETDAQRQNITVALNDALNLSENQLKEKRYQDYSGKANQWDLPTLIYRHFVPDAQKTLGDNFFRDVKEKDAQDQVKKILSTLKFTNQNQAVDTSGWQTYTNSKYGFQLSLPDSWKGYSVTESSWTSWTIQQNGPSVENVNAGPLIAFRDPRWTTKNQLQDIQIMVITPNAWKLIQEGKVSVSAAPIGPGEIGQNQKFIFATEPRWTGFLPIVDAKQTQEAVNIVKTFKALQ